MSQQCSPFCGFCSKVLKLSTIGLMLEIIKEFETYSEYVLHSNSPRNSQCTKYEFRQRPIKDERSQGRHKNAFHALKRKK